MAERAADAAPGAAGLDQWAGSSARAATASRPIYNYDLFEPDRTPRHFGDRPGRLSDRRAHQHVRAAVHRRPGPHSGAVLPLARLPPAPQRGRSRRPRGPALLRGAARLPAGPASAIPPPRYAHSYSRARVPRPPSFDEPNVRDKPKFVRRRPRLSRGDLARIDRDYRCGLAALKALDDGVARIVDHLKATGQLSNTVLMFLTDQGVMAGEHRIKRGNLRFVFTAEDRPQ